MLNRTGGICTALGLCKDLCGDGSADLSWFAFVFPLWHISLFCLWMVAFSIDKRDRMNRREFAGLKHLFYWILWLTSALIRQGEKFPKIESIALRQIPSCNFILPWHWSCRGERRQTSCLSCSLTSRETSEEQTWRKAAFCLGGRYRRPLTPAGRDAAEHIEFPRSL